MTKTTYDARPILVNKLSRDEQLNLIFDLINAFQRIKTPGEAALLLRDLLTAKEVENLSKRLRIAKLLLAGETQNYISKEIHTSSATITKVQAWLDSGGEGLKAAISKLPRRYNLPKNLPKIPLEFQLPRVILALAQASVSNQQKAFLEYFEKGVRDKKALNKSLQEMFDSSFILARKDTRFSALKR